MYSYRFTRAAKKDLEEAYLWYEDRQEELGMRLLDDVERACRYIAQSPDLYPVYNKKPQGMAIPVASLPTIADLAGKPDKAVDLMRIFS